MANEVRVFIEALRAGKSCGDAFVEYCWARSVVPILREDLERSGDPFLCRPAWGMSMADAKGADAFDAGKSDEEIAEAFSDGLTMDRDRALLYRPMKEEERPSPADLIRAMDSETRLRAAEFVGLKAVGHALLGGEFAPAQGIVTEGGDAPAAPVSD